MCTKNYENPSIFVKVTAKKSVAPFLSGHGVYLNCDCDRGLAPNPAGELIAFHRPLPGFKKAASQQKRKGIVERAGKSGEGGREWSGGMGGEERVREE